jgi:hypothetical protein
MEVNGEIQYPAALTLGKASSLYFKQEASWTPEPVRTLWYRQTSFSLPGTETRFLGRPVRSLHTILAF